MNGALTDVVASKLVELAKKRMAQEVEDVPLLQNLSILERAASVIDLHILPRLVAMADEISNEMILAGESKEKMEFVLENFVLVFDSLQTIAGTVEMDEK